MVEMKKNETSEKQVAANKLNALKATGPKSKKGKEISRSNAVTHGLLCSDSLMHPGITDTEEFQRYTRSLTTFLNPQNDLELFFVNRIVSCTWRLKRIVSIEEFIFKNEMGQPGEDTANALFSYIKDKMSVIGRYETSIERSLFKTLNELKKIRDV